MAAFEMGSAHGILHLGTTELTTDLHPTLVYWRDLGRSFVAAVCAALDPTEPSSLVLPDPDVDEMTRLLEAVPPMQGAERLTPELLGTLWSDLETALEIETARHGSLQAFLKKQGSVWHVVGRVCFHLVENRRDPDYPFAFIATYVDRVSVRATPRHRPLGRALDDYAGTRNRKKLLALLAPLSRARRRERPHPRARRVGRHLPSAPMERHRRPPVPLRGHAIRAGWGGPSACRTGEAPAADPDPRSRSRWAGRRRRSSVSTPCSASTPG